MRLTVLALFLSIFAGHCEAQILSAGGAHVNLYFPHLADGGAPSYKWQTSLTFLNGNETVAAHVNLVILSDSGGPLVMDFGQGPISTLNLTIPPGGTKTITSTAATATAITGWAAAGCDQPVQATLQFKAIINGTPQQAVSALSVLPSLRYVSPATALTGVALANVYSAPKSFQVFVDDNNGNTVNQKTVTLPAYGHQSFNLNGLFPSLSASFNGSVRVASTDGATYFVAWTLAVDNSGVVSSYAPGAQEWPISHYDRIYDVYFRTLNAAQTFSDAAGLGLSFTSQAVPLRILSDQYVNAFASPVDNSVSIELALSELISDSPSELAFAVAHEMGHTIQFRSNPRYLFNPNAELDADQWGMLISMIAGYDPYAAAGTLAKLDMARGQAGLLSQLFDQLSGDLHGSFNTRIQLVYSGLQNVCAAGPVGASFCFSYKSVIHPHFPGSVPLLRQPGAPVDLMRP